MQSRKVCFELSYLHSRVGGVGWWWAPLWVLSLRGGGGIDLEADLLSFQMDQHIVLVNSDISG